MEGKHDETWINLADLWLGIMTQQANMTRGKGSGVSKGDQFTTPDQGVIQHAIHSCPRGDEAPFGCLNFKHHRYP